MQSNKEVAIYFEPCIQGLNFLTLEHTFIFHFTMQDYKEDIISIIQNVLTVKKFLSFTNTRMMPF